MFDFITAWIERGGVLAVGALMALENVIPPIPSELVMPLAGFTAARGQMSLLLLIVVGTIGSTLGCLFWYGLARAWGRERFLRFVDRWGVWLTLSREEAEGATEWFERHGAPAVFFGRMVPTVRTLISIPAGLAPMPLVPFILWTAAGALIWTSLLAFAGYLLEDQYERVEGWLNPVTTGVLVLIVGLYLYRLVRGLLRRR